MVGGESTEVISTVSSLCVRLGGCVDVGKRHHHVCPRSPARSAGPGSGRDERSSILQCHRSKFRSSGSWRWMRVGP